MGAHRRLHTEESGYYADSVSEMKILRINMARCCTYFWVSDMAVRTEKRPSFVIFRWKKFEIE